MQMPDPHHELSDSEQRIVQVLVDEHVRVSCYLVPIDDETWAIRGSIAVDGEVIVAEFHDRTHAEFAVEQLSAAEHGATVARPSTPDSPDSSRADREDGSSGRS
jgi:hypothetical protein